MHAEEGIELKGGILQCAYCGGELESAALPKTVHEKPTKEAQNYATVRICKKCGRVYWPEARRP